MAGAVMGGGGLEEVLMGLGGHRWVSIDWRACVCEMQGVGGCKCVAFRCIALHLACEECQM
jgi:hypothetical protein